jgi:hypothetical protein
MKTLQSVIAYCSVLLYPTLLFAWNFRDTIDSNYRVSFPVNNAYEVKKKKSSQIGKTYKIHPRGSKRFICLVSVLKTPERNLDLKFAREQTEEHGKKLLGRTAEKELRIEELKDAENTKTVGYYFRLTDANPAPDGYLYAIQGVMPKEKSFITFTYLYNYESKEEFKHITGMLAGIVISYDNRNSKIAPLLLNEGDIPGATLGKELIAKSIQVQYFFLQPDAYSAMLPPLIEKDIQSVQTAREQGSVMFFRYERNIEDIKGFFTGLFYGEAKAPFDEHPEEFIIHNDTMIIFCFERKSVLGPDVKKKILEKMK